MEYHMDKEIINKLRQIYHSMRKVRLPEVGAGWVDIAAFGYRVNKARIDYKGTNKSGKLIQFLRQSSIFEFYKSPSATFLRALPKGLSSQELNKKKEQEEEEIVLFEEKLNEETHCPFSLNPHDVADNKPLISENQLSIFTSLKKSNEDDWKTLSKSKWIGIWKSVIEKYPKTAHFIYELIQNADDALATEATIILFKDKLIFKHNGKRQFTLTDEQDPNSPVGDINSITSVANSTKKDDSQTIGKFGVGFKSVFQYTDSPCIYDDTFWFKIENYIIPVLLDCDNEYRYNGETLFEIPFNNERAYQDILERLNNLDMPTLFLPHVKTIFWKLAEEEDVHVYSKKILQSKTRNDVKYYLCKLSDCGKDRLIYQFYKFLKTTQGSYFISVGFFINENGLLDSSIRPNIYCFFPTNEKFESCFISHAPFLLTDNRESIKDFEQINKTFLNGIADLAAESLLCLRDIAAYRKNNFFESYFQQESLSPIINDNLFFLANIKSETERNVYLKERYIETIRRNSLILTKSGFYADCSHALIGTPDIEALIKSEHIFALYNKGYDFVYLDQHRRDLREIADEIGINNFGNEALAKKLTSSFMESQSLEWINRLIEHIKENARSLWVDRSGKKRIVKNLYNNKEDSWETLLFRFAPIAMSSEGKWISPFSLYKEQANIVLPFTGLILQASSIFGAVLDNDLYASHKVFYDNLGLKRPTINDYIIKAILPHYINGKMPNTEVAKKDFETIIQSIGNKAIPKDLKEALIKEWMVMGINQDGVQKACKLESLYLYDEDLQKFITNPKDYFFIDVDYYEIDTNKITTELIYKVMKELGVGTSPKIISENVCCTESISYSSYRYTNSEKRLKNDLPERIKSLFYGIKLSKTYDAYFCDYMIDGYDINNVSVEWSFLLWKILSRIDAYKYCESKISFYVYRGKSECEKGFDSTIIRNLKNDNWIAINEDSFCRPKDITKEQFLSLGYEKNNWVYVLDFCDNEYDSIFNREEKERQEELERKKEEEEAERNDLISRALDSGVNINELLKEAILNAEATKADNQSPIATIVDNLSVEEIGILAEQIKSGSYTTFKQQEIPRAISNNIETLLDITKKVGEQNLYYVAEHAQELFTWHEVDNDSSPARRIVNFIGKKIYEQYLISEGIDYKQLSNHESDCDYIIDDGEIYVKVISTLKTIADYKIPVGLSAAQNAFLKKHYESDLRVIRISFKDLKLLQKYENLIAIYGLNDPYSDEDFRIVCEEFAIRYWEHVDIDLFDDASPEYSIKIERKN